MKKIRYIFIGLLLLVVGSAAAQTDTLFVPLAENLGAEFTVKLTDAQLVNADSSFTMIARRTLYRGVAFQIYADKILGNGAVVAKNFDGGLDKHTYIISRVSTKLNLYRDGYLLASVSEARIPIKTSSASETSEVTLAHSSGLKSGYAYALTSTLNSEKPDETAMETNLSNMLAVDYNNMVTDPYMNHGFLCDGVGADNRTFYSNASIYSGWGAEASLDKENAYSGPYCIKLSGQAYYNATAPTGASIDLPLTFSANTSYLVRAMVKSVGYKGKIAIDGESGYVLISDTEGKWKQIEGILTTTVTRTLLTINNRDFENTGTLYIDNLEVYKASTNSTIGNSTATSLLQASAGTTYSSSIARNIYMIGITQNESSYSQVNLDNITYSGATCLTKTVAGSALYPIKLNGPLETATVTGYFDGSTHTAEPIFNGIDFMVLKYVAPYFEYLPIDEPVEPGSYLFQFVDNFDGKSISLISGADTSTVATVLPSSHKLVGNPILMDYTPTGKFYKFNAASQKFVLTENETVMPLEAYITASETDLGKEIYPMAVPTGFQNIKGEDGSRLGIYTKNGGVTINAQGATAVDVFSISGQKIATFQLSEGANEFVLPEGFYFIGGQKVIINP
ncbi:MAG: hypothetical protein WCQ86_03755 [Bacteroidaceae bacterium]